MMNKYKVCVRCTTYNHAPFIKYAMDGFTSQETEFDYVCNIVDDCSTDGEKDVLERYFADNFTELEMPIELHKETEDYLVSFGQHKINKNCYFAIYYLKYNHFRKKSKLPYMIVWSKIADYIASCEGDDYWTDSMKLQKQVNALDNDATLSFSFHRCKTTSGKVRYPELTGNRRLKAKDIILTHYIPTASLIYRSALEKEVSIYKLTIGDIPREIQLAMNGDVAYFDEAMSVYRDDNQNSITHNKEHNRRGIYDYLKMYTYLLGKYKFRKESVYLLYKMMRSIAQIPLIYRNVYLRNLK